MPFVVVDTINPITESQQTRFDFLDSLIEDRVSDTKKGEWLEVVIEADSTIVSRLKSVWEERHYSVGVFLVETGANQTVNKYRLVLVPGTVTKNDTVSASSLTPLPALQKTLPITLPEFGMGGGRRVLVRMPTRGRPAQAIDVLTKYRMMAGVKIDMECVIDYDDQTMNNCAVIQRLASLGCVVTAGYHKSKIEAVNAGRVDDWDILVLASDDMVPIQNMYALEIINMMDKHFPFLDGAIHIPDGFANEGCMTLPILGRKLWEQFPKDEKIYHKGYVSLWSDVEQFETLRAMGKIQFVNRNLIEHKHPGAQKAKTDDIYKKNDVFENADKELYEKRRNLYQRHGQIPFDAPPIVLSICIASVINRRAQLKHLVSEIYRQIIADAPRKVEVLIEPGDNRVVGEVRNKLLQRAHGHMVSFVDDDDWISPDYVSRIVKAIEDSDFTADCVGLVGTMTTNGEKPERFEHSIKNSDWSTEYDNNGNVARYLRMPNHLNPVRRDLAIAAGFPTKSFGEDHDYSKRLYPMLKKEVSTGDDPYYFYFFWSKQNVGE